MNLLGLSIRAARKENGISEAELAERAGVSRGVVQRVEKGDLSCGVGTVFELAYIVGIQLLDLDNQGLSQQISQVENKLTLLPKAIHQSSKVINDDF